LKHSKILVIVFLSSLFASNLFTLLIRLVGIGWDYHIDAVNYIDISSQMSEILHKSSNIFSFLNNGYYIWVSTLNSKIFQVRFLNSFFYSAANLILTDAFLSRFGSVLKPTRILLLLTPVFLFPYNLYLSTTLLKDSLNLFLLAITFSQFVKYKSLLSLPSLAALVIVPFIRLQSIVLIFLTLKLGLNIKSKCIYVLIVLSFILTLNAYLDGDLLDSITRANEVSMRFRDYDSVPTFQQYGLLGTIARVLVWPFLLSSGTFLLISFSPEFAMAGLGYLLLQLASIFLLRKINYISVSAFLIMGLIATQTTGFTSFIRYCFPVCVYSYILLCSTVFEQRFRFYGPSRGPYVAI